MIGSASLLPVVSGYRPDLSRHASNSKRLGCYPELLPLPLERGTGRIGVEAVPATGLVVVYRVQSTSTIAAASGTPYMSPALLPRISTR